MGGDALSAGMLEVLRLGTAWEVLRVLSAFSAAFRSQGGCRTRLVMRVLQKRLKSDYKRDCSRNCDNTRGSKETQKRLKSVVEVTKETQKRL